MNVMVMGKTGSGKSTLINNMFNEKLADTGIGKPVTQAIRQYSKEGFPLTIYDTPGLELGGDNAISELLKDATDCIKKGVKSGKMDDAIHCILYCVNAGTHRFEDAEKEFIAQFLSENKAFNIPVIVVITQAVNKKDAAESGFQPHGFTVQHHRQNKGDRDHQRAGNNRIKNTVFQTLQKDGV